MKRYTAVLVFGLVLFISTGSVFAQSGPQGQFGYGFPGPQGFTGQMGYGFPGQLQTVSVNQARTFGNKMPVALTGNLVQFTGGRNLYVFRDASGDVLVKIGPKEWQTLWYQGISIDPSETIEIYGEVHWPKHSWGTPEIHARFIRKI